MKIEMDAANEKFIVRASCNTSLDMDKKFRRGYIEHDGQFMTLTKEQLLDEIGQEINDLNIYIRRLREL